MQALDLVGPWMRLPPSRSRMARAVAGPGLPKVLTIGFGSKAVAAESGLLITPQFTTAAAPES